MMMMMMMMMMYFRDPEHSYRNETSTLYAILTQVPQFHGVTFTYISVGDTGIRGDIDS